MGSSESDKPSPNDLAFQSSLVSCFKTALQAYQVRAAECGQTYEHMVLLEAAVQGWQVTSWILSLLKHCSHSCKRTRALSRLCFMHSREDGMHGKELSDRSTKKKLCGRVYITCSVRMESQGLRVEPSERLLTL